MVKHPALRWLRLILGCVLVAGAIDAAVKAIIDGNPEKVVQYREKPSLFGWFVGQVMKSTGGKANPKVVNELLKKALDA